MKKTRKQNKNIIIILLLVLLLVLAVGYAAFSDVLTISGTANAKGTFNLEFQNAEIVTLVGVNETGTKAEISEDKNTLNVNVVDLAYPGAGVEFSVDIVNIGSIPAVVSAVTPTNITGSEHIKIEGLEAITTAHPTIEAGGKCNIHFTVEWPVTATTPLGENGESTNFGLEIEYTQGTTKVFEGTAKHEDENAVTSPPVIPTNSKLIETIEPSDYGKSINYTAVVKGEEVNNWKVLYNDGTNVYIILDDYLENRLLPTETGLQTSGKYGVFSDINRETLLEGLTTESNWSEFANGVEGAIAKGATTIEILMESYNEKNGTNLSYTEFPFLGTNDLLYIPHTIIEEECIGYWLSSPVSNNETTIWMAHYDSQILTNYYNIKVQSVRPIVILPNNTTGIVEETIEIEK